MSLTHPQRSDRKRPVAPPGPAPAGERSHNGARAAGLACAFVLLVLVCLLSVVVGARHLPPLVVWHGLLDSASDSATVVREMRLPRTLLGLLAGTALGIAGGVMQAITRNPLADPGVLGINAGASASVVTAISALGVTTFDGYVWFAFLGAAVVSALVYVVGGGSGATPARLALAGTAIGAAVYSYVNAVQLLDTASLDRMRFWTVGSLAAAQTDTAVKMAPFVALGGITALALASSLNALALGDDMARALGVAPATTRAVAMAAVTLLCGAATAACGPIVFVGLAVPHMVRAVTGPDLRWLLAYCTVLAPVLFLGADVLGRILARPAEIQVGVMTALLGGPFFLALVRRNRTVGA
ncbi:iron complex transport system permease protein [Haloactinospora alba]|uniref:Iron complex transport system permease protein n=1 Tax=Haloactinospora alba TaxID=405555 RepID=A0A543NHV2_9ACTN|nr:iron chelate uptake ABC transporter family permease subunit [Haloactinospora alba]TQN31427.1 iron complex transport system permease protein [Haloactinospora alba]